jgi:hypothetical protein
VKNPHKLTINPTGKPGRVKGTCSCGRWSLTSFETSVKNTHRQHVADEARKN